MATRYERIVFRSLTLRRPVSDSARGGLLGGPRPSHHGAMSRYMVASSEQAITHAEQRHVGRRCQPCTGKGHLLYVLPLSDAEVAEFRRASWSLPAGGGRRAVALAGGDSVFVSANPACRWPGTALAPRTDRKGASADAGPIALSP